MLSKLGLEVAFESLTVILGEIYRRCDVKIVEEVSDVEENRMACLEVELVLGRVYDTQ